MSRRSRLLTSLAASLLVFSTVLPVAAQSQSAYELVPERPVPVVDLSGEWVDETPRSYFVEFSSPPTIEGGTASSRQREKENFRNAARGGGVKYKERFEYDTLFNGLVVQVESPADVQALARMEGVKSIWPVITIDRPQVDGATLDPEMFTALAMTGADYTQTELGYTGRGIQVAVMDTGVDYDHPDLGGGFGRGFKVAKGWDFVGDDFNMDPSHPGYNPVAVPDNDPDDCDGHGTHVAGIIGANGTVKGVAPEVTIGAYRVFGCEGSTSADIMLAAMEKAYKDGMDILNMSIGSTYQWPEYPTAKAASRLVDKGMVVVASIGNSGANGLYAAGAPGTGEKVIGVANFENSHLRLSQFTISPDGMPIGYGTAAGSIAAPLSGTADLARTGTPTTPDDACAALPAGSLAGKVALIRRGTCPFHTKALNAQNAGAAGVVLYNNVPGSISPTVAGTPAITIPVVAISQADGHLVDSRLAAGSVTLTWTDQQGTFPNNLAGLISSSSSYGLAADLSLKPDIGAPGANIYSTYPLELGGYASLTGTSMSSPHVAGTAALLLEAKPKTKAVDVRDILQNSAEPALWWGAPSLGFLDNVHRQGAGMVQIDRAILATTRIQPGKLSLGESESGPITKKLTIRNDERTPVTYSLSHVPALATGPNAYSPSFYAAFADVAFSKDSITVPGRGSVTVNVTITAPEGFFDGGIYGGYLVFTPTGGGQTYRVPYAGYQGDYQARQVLTPAAYGFPLLAREVGGGYDIPDEGAVFTMADGDIPYVLAHFNAHSRLFKLEVKPVDSDRWLPAGKEEYLPPNSSANGFFAFAFDGTISAGKRSYPLPNGEYLLKVSVLKALGKESNPDHWESWTSPVFVIERP